MTAYVSDGKRVKVVSAAKHGDHTEEHYIGGINEDGRATFYKTKEGTHPSGHIDLADCAGKVAWSSRAKGAAKKALKEG